MQMCSACKENKSLDCYSMDRNTKNKKRKRCKACDAEASAVRRKGMQVQRENRKPAPPWLTEEHLYEIRGFYELARVKTVRKGIQHVVDHIIPLGAKNVCGLHVPWNLQVLDKRGNSMKGTKFDGGW